jgi:hypothetical protein
MVAEIRARIFRVLYPVKGLISRNFNQELVNGNS